MATLLDGTELRINESFDFIGFFLSVLDAFLLAWLSLLLCNSGDVLRSLVSKLEPRLLSKHDCRIFSILLSLWFDLYFTQNGDLQ